MDWRVMLRLSGCAKSTRVGLKSFFSVVAMAASVGILAVPAVQAAPVQIRPAPVADCESLKLAFEKLIGLPLKLKRARPDRELFSVHTSGEACVITGGGSGARGLFGDVQIALDEHFQNGRWKEVLEIAVDGPDSTRVGYAKGNRMVAYFLSSEAPEGQCEPDPNSEDLPECNLPAGGWVWAIDIIAYDKVR